MKLVLLVKKRLYSLISDLVTFLHWHHSFILFFGMYVTKGRTNILIMYSLCIKNAM